MTRHHLGAWLLSAVGGASIALLTLTLGVRGLLALVALCAIATRFVRPSLAIGGVLAGCGAVFVAVFASAEARCSGAGEGYGSCVAASGNPFGLTVALGFLVAAALLTGSGMRAAR